MIKIKIVHLKEATKKFIEEEVKLYHAILFPNGQMSTPFLSIKNEAGALDVLKKIEGDCC